MSSLDNSEDSENSDLELKPIAAGLNIPDISGEWSMDIHWQREQKAGRVSATAIIKQDFARVNMEVHSSGSNSYTLLQRDEGQADDGGANGHADRDAAHGGAKA